MPRSATLRFPEPVRLQVRVAIVQRSDRPALLVSRLAPTEAAGSDPAADVLAALRQSRLLAVPLAKRWALGPDPAFSLGRPGKSRCHPIYVSGAGAAAACVPSLAQSQLDHLSGGRSAGG